MSEITAHLQHFDDAWGHDFESLTYALEGVTEEEAAWQAPCYAADEREEGWPAPGTVAWQAAHVAHCKRYYTQILLRAGETDPPEAEPWTPLSTYAEIRAALDAAHAAQRAAVAALPEERLGEIAGNGMPFREFLAMFTRHDAWHASQVVVARRLYRTRPDAG